MFFNHNVSITCMEKVCIGSNSFFGNNVVIVDHDHAIIDGQPSGGQFRVAQVEIGENCWIGANVVITRGVSIGSNAIVAAGSVVTKDVPFSTLVAGVPAKVLRTL